MLHIFDFVRELDFLAITVRLIAAVVCGGVIGIEREFKRRPAGFRTHILICLGAAMTTLTSQYMYLTMHLFTDIARLGAQVIAGIGFIGAGTIIVTKSKRVKGLTTAAGLWTSAIIGLACGAGYLECALFATVMILFAELVLVKLEYNLAREVNDVNLYIEYRHAICIENIIRIIREERIKLTDLEITRVVDEGEEDHHYCAMLSVQASRKQLEGQLIKSINDLDGTILIEEM